MKLRQVKRKIAKPKKNITGFVIWSGLSPMDNTTPIAAIVTLKSGNGKTGNMLQTWVMRTDIPPIDVVQSKQDDPICGDCNFKSHNGCYVRIDTAPTKIYKSFIKGNYLVLNFADIALLSVGRQARIGTYGDPCMIPTNIWQQLIKNSSGHTGYTHGYNLPFFDVKLLDICMLSADTLADSIKYNKLGYRTFTAIAGDENIPPGQLVCPYFTNEVPCIDCLLCDGSMGNGKSIIAPIHGIKHVIDKFSIARYK